MKTERLHLLVSPEDKARFNKLAADAGTSTAEFILTAARKQADKIERRNSAAQ